jgi:hypothetical protein
MGGLREGDSSIGGNVTRDTRQAITDLIGRAWSLMEEESDPKRHAVAKELLTEALAMYEPAGRQSRVGERRPVESAEQWWASSLEAAVDLDVSRQTVVNACSGNSSPKVKGVGVRYSPHTTFAAFSAARPAARVA